MKLLNKKSNYKILFLLCLIFFCLFSISSICATSIDNNTNTGNEGFADYYVSNNGSDSNQGTQEYPFKTIDKAISKSKENQTTNIYLLEGIFTGSGNVNLTVDNNINIIGISCEKTIVDGSDDIGF